MNATRKVKILICLLVIILVASLGFTGYVLFQNYWWKLEATRYADSSARLEAHAGFRKGIYSLYRIEGQCDEPTFLDNTTGLSRFGLPSISHR